MKQEIKPVNGVVVDSSPDERGNVMAAAVIGERRIALILNTN